MSDHRGMPGTACTDEEPLCPLTALVEVARPDLGRGGWVTIMCDPSRGGCGRSTLPFRRARKAKQLVAAGRTEKPKPWRDGPAPWAR